VRVLFCGLGFPEAFQLLRERLPDDEVIACSEDRVLQSVTGVDVVIPAMSLINAEVMAASGMRLIQQWGTGLEGVDLDMARRRGIWVANVRSGTTFNAESVADLALLHILGLIRDLSLAQANVRAGRLGGPVGKSLAQCTVSLFGLGDIGRALARRLGVCGTRLIGISRHPDTALCQDIGLAECFSTEDRFRALSQSDVLVLCLPLTQETRGIIGAAELAALPKGSFLVNVGRGALVDYHSLLSALGSEHLGGAGLDVFWQEPINPQDPLLSFPNVITTPHIGGVTEQSYGAIADAVVANIDRLRRNVPPCDQVV
jgi:phosphoglycerate dehydrogenase-like enzyme